MKFSEWFAKTFPSGYDVSYNPESIMEDAWNAAKGDCNNQFTFTDKRLMAWLFESALCSDLIDDETKDRIRGVRVKFERMTEKKDRFLHGNPNETDRRDGIGLGK